MYYNGVDRLVIVEEPNMEKKFKQISQKHFLPVVKNRRRRRLDTILHDDIVPVHRANLVKSRKERQS